MTAIPWPIGTLPIVEPDHFSTGRTIPRVSPGKSMPVLRPKPKRSIQRASRFWPSICATVIVPTFDERERIWATVMRWVARSCESWILRSATSISYGSVKAVLGETICGRQRRGNRDQLEGRARLVRVRHGPVALKIARRLPVAVRVEAGHHRHREDLAVPRVEHDRGGRLRAPVRDRALEDALGVRLNRVVEREDDIVAVPGRHGLDDVDRAACRVADEALVAHAARQRTVQLQLEPGQTAVVEPRVAEHLGGDPALRVGTALLRAEEQTGDPALLQLLRPLRVGLAGEEDEAARAIGELRVELLGVEAEILRGRERRRPWVDDLARVGEDGGRVPPDRELETRPVEQGAAAGRQGHSRVVLLGGQPRQRPRLHRLQPDCTPEHGRERHREDGEEKADAPVGQARAHRRERSSVT